MLEKLTELKNIRPDEKDQKMSLKYMYQENFLLKILGLLDFYTSLALTSPSALAFI